SFFQSSPVLCTKCDLGFYLNTKKSPCKYAGRIEFVVPPEFMGIIIPCLVLITELSPSRTTQLCLHSTSSWATFIQTIRKASTICSSRCITVLVYSSQYNRIFLFNSLPSNH